MTRGRQFWTWATIVMVFLVGLYLVREILLPFIAGVAIAYFLDPILDRLEKWGLSRLIATIILTTTFFISVITLITLIVPLLQGQMFGFFQKLPAITDAAIQWLTPLRTILKEHIPTEQLGELSLLSKSFGGPAVKWMIRLVKGVFEGGLVIFNFISLYFSAFEGTAYRTSVTGCGFDTVAVRTPAVIGMIRNMQSAGE